MDISNLRRGELLAGIGGLVLFISMFLNWYGWSVSGPFGGGVSVSAQGWDESGIWVLILVVVMVIAIGLGLLRAMQRDINLPLAASALTAGAGIVGAVVVIINLLSTPGDSGLRFGIFVALVGAVVVAIGGWLSMQEEGTTFGEAKEQLSESVSGLGGPGSQGPPPGESQPPPSEPPAGPPPGESQPPPGGPPPSDPAAGG